MSKQAMTCREFISLLPAYRDGELGGRERARADEHLAACHKCASYLRGYERTIELAKAAFADPDEPGEPEVLEDLAQAILASRRKL